MSPVAQLFLAAAVSGAAATRLGAPPRRPPMLTTTPFSKIADEIHEAEVAAEELTYKVSNSTEEKASVQWFLATAMKELTNLQKVVMNRTVAGTLGYEYQRCINKTTAKLPGWNQSLTLGEAMEGTQWQKPDTELAPSTVDGRMYEVYSDEEKIEELTKQLGQCEAEKSCEEEKTEKPSLLSRARAAAKRREDPAAAPAPAAGGGGGVAHPHPRELMKGVAEAIYNTSHEIDQMKLHLKKDIAAESVLGSLSAMVMNKLLKAHGDVHQMKLDLEVCNHAAEATFLNDAVKEAMSEDTELSLEIVKEAEAQTVDVEGKVKDLEAKLKKCQAKC